MHTVVVFPSVSYSQTYQSFLQSAISVHTSPYLVCYSHSYQSVFSLLSLYLPVLIQSAIPIHTVVVLPSVCSSCTHQSLFSLLFQFIPVLTQSAILYIPVLIQSAIPIHTSPYSVCYSYTHQSLFSLLFPDIRVLIQFTIPIHTSPYSVCCSQTYQTLFSLLFLYTQVLIQSGISIHTSPYSVCYSHTYQSLFSLLFLYIPVLIQSAIPIRTNPCSVYCSYTYQSLFSLLLPDIPDRPSFSESSLAHSFSAWTVFPPVSWSGRSRGSQQRDHNEQLCVLIDWYSRQLSQSQRGNRSGSCLKSFCGVTHDRTWLPSGRTRCAAVLRK